MTTVRTKQELKTAKNEGAAEIVVVGDLAQKLKTAKKIALLGGASIAALAAAIGAATITAPVSGGLSYFAAASVAALTGTEIAAIIAASALGISLVLAVYKDYEEISYKNGEMILRKRKN